MAEEDIRTREELLIEQCEVFKKREQLRSNIAQAQNMIRECNQKIVELEQVLQKKESK